MRVDPYVRTVTIDRVVDGDTFDATVDLGYLTTCRHRFRLLGVDAPEKKLDTLTAGKAAQAWVEGWVADHAKHHCVVRSEKDDSFGRWLGDVGCVDCSTWLTDDLVEAGHATRRQWQRR